MKNLKLMMMTLMMSLMFMSCEKDKNCNCGIITNDNIEISNGELFYTLTIKNDCPGNHQKFYFKKVYRPKKSGFGGGGFGGGGSGGSW
jgi:hypothetical protein